jgi:hypothetical protein
MISFFTLLTDDFQINVYNISSISLIISILGLQVIESVKNQFWKDVLYAWKSVIEKDENKDWTNFLANRVWLNKQVKIDKRTIIYPEWFNRGVNDFVNDDENHNPPSS